ncbi:MAG: hypothetical protein Q9217_002001 [Psora testacea]
MAIILSINSGSSSVKVSIYRSSSTTEPPMKLADAHISGLTAPPAKLTYIRGSQKVKGQEVDGIQSNEDACERILNYVVEDRGLVEISSRDDITHVCHRVVHGGDYPNAHVIDQDTYNHLEDLTDLAPLHNASALAIVKSCLESLPKAKNITYFDSSFHATIPDAVRTYAIDQEVAERNRLRKYGFHGISYAFITRAVAVFLSKEQEDTNIIALHLGSGASACAIHHGKSIDNSMGLTPLAGLPGATRSGDVDPSLIFHFTHDAGKPSPNSTQKMHISTAEDILNKQSGWKALTGTTDFGTISGSEDPKCKLAFELFVDRIVAFVGSYYVKLGGEVDALVFAGGIGEKAARLREVVVERCECLGFRIDKRKNGKEIKDVVQDVGKESARHKTLVCQTDEQFEMARQFDLSYLVREVDQFTVLMRVFAENKACAVSIRLVFMGREREGSSFKAGHSIFMNPQNPSVVAAAKAAEKRYLVNKDELGHDLRKHECYYDLFPNAACYLSVKPAFLFRDPVRILDSWKALGWDNVDSLKLWSVLARLSTDRGTNIDDMQKLNLLILAEKTTAAFTDGRTFREYRKERFEALTWKLQLSCDDECFNLLSDIYEATLAASLRLKSGASSLLTTLKKLGN